MRKTFIAIAFASTFALALPAGVAWSWQDEEPARLDPPPAREAPPAASQESRTTDQEGVEVTDAHAATFQGVCPGVTTAEEVRKLLGKPAREEIEDQNAVLTYRIEPFAKVEVLLAKDQTISVVIHLKRPTPAVQIAKDLSLDSFRPAPIPDESGELLGLAYPERGVTLALVSQTDDNSVSQVLLEAVSAEPFVLRVLHDAGHNYERNLADLEFAAKQDQADSRVPWLKAQTLAAMGQREKALVSIDKAIELDGESADYRLARAALLGEAGAYEMALAETREVLARKVLSVETRARAECLIGDLLAAGPAQDFKQALECHQAAIKLAAEMAADPRFTVRRAAKQVLVDAHLGVAHDIACGPWKRKLEVLPKWLDRVEICAREFIENDRADISLKLSVARRMLGIQAVVRGELDARATTDGALSEVARLFEGDRDPYFRRRVAWEFAQAMHDAARIEQAGWQAERALALLERAIPLLEQDLANRPATPDEEYLLGKLYFVGGTVLARQSKSHGEAVEWYEKAAPRLVAGQAAAAAEPEQHGRRFVSMGVSYWEIEAREDALRITRQGVELMQSAADAGLIDPTTLKIPYGNLASMCQQSGQIDQARRYASLAAKVGGGEPTQQR